MSADELEAWRCCLVQLSWASRSAPLNTSSKHCAVALSPCRLPQSGARRLHAAAAARAPWLQGQQARVPGMGGRWGGCWLDRRSMPAACHARCARILPAPSTARLSSAFHLPPWQAASARPTQASWWAHWRSPAPACCPAGGATWRRRRGWRPAARWRAPRRRAAASRRWTASSSSPAAGKRGPCSFIRQGALARAPCPRRRCPSVICSASAAVCEPFMQRITPVGGRCPWAAAWKPMARAQPGRCSSGAERARRRQRARRSHKLPQCWRSSHTLTSALQCSSSTSRAQRGSRRRQPPLRLAHNNEGGRCPSLCTV